MTWKHRTASLCALALGLALLGCSGEPGSSSADATEAAALGSHVIGHRGAPKQVCENTIASYEEALAQGADALEIDICLTADGHVVVWHDRDPDDGVALARQAGLEELPYIPWVPEIEDPHRDVVEHLTLDELREHYGYQLRADLLSNLIGQGERDPSARIPTLPEVADWARGSKLRQLYLDVKLAADQTELARELAEAVATVATDASYGIYLMSPHPDVVVAMRAQLGERATELGVGFVLDNEDSGAYDRTTSLGIASLATGRTPLRTWSGYLEELERIVEHRDRGDGSIRNVVAWTIDDEDELEELLDVGVDGIMTNEPALLFELAQR